MKKKEEKQGNMAICCYVEMDETVSNFACMHG